MARRSPGRPVSAPAGPEPSFVDAAYESAKATVRKLKALREAREARGSLRAFMRLGWPAIEPGLPFVPGRHIDAICEHLEAVRKGQIRDLLITCPPRSTKSTAIDVCWPAWDWLENPWRQFTFLSHEAGLTVRDSLRMRRLIEGAWYQGHWGKVFRLVDDQNTIDNYANDKGGFRQSMTPASVTGKGSDILVYDDPHKAAEVDSDTIRRKVIEDFDQAISSRYRDPRTFCRVVVMQRLHEKDLIGHLLEKGGWEHLDIANEYDGRKISTAGLSMDWRTKPGELMWPERLDRAAVDRLKRDLGPRAYSAQYQQRPAPASGGIFKRHYWRYYTRRGDSWSQANVEFRNERGEILSQAPSVLPDMFEQVVLSWDMTFKDTDGSDFVAGHAWGRVGANFYLLGRVKRRMDFIETLKAFREMAAEYPCPAKLVEDKANGPAVISTLHNEIPGLIAVDPKGGKVSRANAVSPYFESMNVYLPTPLSEPWVYEFVEEAANFPAAAHDDDIDAMTQAIKYLADSISLSAAPEFRAVPRFGDPGTASHVIGGGGEGLESHWRRFVAVSIGEESAAVWICHRPDGTLRVYRELMLAGLNAVEIGEAIARASAADAIAKRGGKQSRWNFSVWLENECFEEIDAGGSIGELIENGIDSYIPESGQWDLQNQSVAALRAAGLHCEALEESDEASWQRLRNLLRVSPPKRPEVIWDRNRAVELARTDFEQYRAYMEAVDGIEKEIFPKIKFIDCPQLCAALGGSRTDDKDFHPLVKALLLGISVPVESEKVVPIIRSRRMDAGRKLPSRFRRAARA